MKKYIWLIILALVYVYEEWDEITATPEPSKTGSLDFWKPATGGTTPVIPANPTPPSPAPSVPVAVGGDRRYQLAESAVSYSPATAPGVVEWDKFGTFSLNPNEVAIYYDCPLPSDLSKAFSRGVTHLSEFRVSGRPLSEVPKAKRLKMIQANAMPAPWTGNASPETIGNMTDGQIDAMTDNHMGGGYDWACIDFEPNEDTSDRAAKWAYIRERVARRLKDVHGITHVNTYDVGPVPVNATTPNRSHQWNLLEKAIQNGRIDSGNNVPYFYLDTWEQNSNGQWWAVQEGFGWNDRTDYIAERKRTEWKWFYKHVLALEMAGQAAQVDCVSWLTWGWAQCGFPDIELKAVRPDMLKAGAIFGLMFPRTKGTGLWGENNVPNFPLHVVEKWIEGTRIMSEHNDMRTGTRRYVTPLLSFDNGQTWAQPGNAQNRLPFVQAIVKNNEILIAANDPTLYAGTKQVLVGYGDFIAPLTLRAYDTTVARGSKETNF